MIWIISTSIFLVQTDGVSLNVLVIDETLGEPTFVQQLLEDLDQVARAVVIKRPEALNEVVDFVPDVLVLGSTWLGRARELRLRFSNSAIIGRSPWHGEVECEFFPWGDELREPTLPITNLIPA